jgi:ureidoacrylate peracid hydrolase
MPATDYGLFDVYRAEISKTALAVVDVQNDFCHHEGVFGKYRKVDLGHVNQAVKNLAVFIRKCRQFKLPIVFIKTTHSTWTDSPSWVTRLKGADKKMRTCPAGSWGSDFFGVAPKKGDCVVIKHRYSAFVKTDLDLILRSRGIENVIVTGVVTNVCVESTARDGFNRDYNVILLEDCCGAYGIEEHAATLHNIRTHFGSVITSGTLADILKRKAK